MPRESRVAVLPWEGGPWNVADRESKRPGVHALPCNRRELEARHLDAAYE